MPHEHEGRYLERPAEILAWPLATSRSGLEIPETGLVAEEGKGFPGRSQTATQATQAAQQRGHGQCGADAIERCPLTETVAEIRRRYRELQEAEREERRKCAEAFKAEREARERDKSKRRPKPGKVFPLDPIGPPQLIKQRDYDLRRTWRTSE